MPILYCWKIRMDLKAYKKNFDKYLATTIKKKITFAQRVATRPRPQQIIAYIEDNLLAGGKRLRPYLVYLGYRLYGWWLDKDIYQFSVASELIHSFALVHDDIIDKWTMRHSMPCVHVFASDLIHSKNQEHLGVSQAILVGDLLHAWAYDVIYNFPYAFPVQYLKNAQKNMQTMIEEVIAGQMLDVDLMVGDHVDSEKLETKNHFKSWQYSFTRPFMTGAMLAWADKKMLTQIEKMTTLLWKAYQMRDDILDVTFQAWENTSHYDNKTKFSDIQEWQQTYLTNYIYEKWTYADRLVLSRAMGKKLSTNEIEELRTMFINSGAIAHAEELLHKYVMDAKKIIDKVKVPMPEYKKYLYEILVLLETI